MLHSYLLLNRIVTRVVNNGTGLLTGVRSRHLLTRAKDGLKESAGSMCIQAIKSIGPKSVVEPHIHVGVGPVDVKPRGGNAI